MFMILSTVAVKWEEILKNTEELGENICWAVIHEIENT